MGETKPRSPSAELRLQERKPIYFFRVLGRDLEGLHLDGSKKVGKKYELTSRHQTPQGALRGLLFQEVLRP